MLTQRRGAHPPLAERVSTQARLCWPREMEEWELIGYIIKRSENHAALAEIYIKLIPLAVETTGVCGGYDI